jgi:MFS family permease
MRQKIGRDRKIIYLAGFLFAFPLALTSYISSSFLSGYINESYVGIIYIVASVITIWGMAEMPKVLTRWGDRKTTLYFSILTLVALLVLAFGNKSFLIIGAFILFFIASTIVGTTLDIFLEDFSTETLVGRFRGFYISVIYVAWVISEMISGSVIDKSSLRGIYLLSALFMLLIIVVFTLFLSDYKDPKYEKEPVSKTIQYFLKNKHASRIYFVNFILQFFYAWMIIYMPIYLHQHIGFAWDKIGLIFMIMLLPFVLLSYPLGKLSDKIGEKKMLIFGFVIITFFTSLIPLIDGQIFLLWAGVLFATRIGAATIGVMSDSYFFKVVTKENAEATSFYRNTYPLSYIIGPAIAIPTLLLVSSFEYLFFVLVGVLLLGLFVSLRLKDVR